MKNSALILFSVLTGLCYGVQTYLSIENDTLLKKSDNDYSHGTKFEVADDNGFHYLAQQNMYTPNDLKEKHHIPGERPYAGILLGGVGYEVYFDPQSPWTHYTELDFGMIGPAAMCKDTQTMIHKLLDCRKPQGWDDQLHNEFVVNGQWWTKYNYYITKWMALVPRFGALAGTLQDALEAGVDLKIGYNIRPTVRKDVVFNNGMMFRGVKGSNWYDKLTAYVYAGLDERYYLYNHILEGSFFTNKDKDLSVDIEPFVSEFRFGAVIKYDNFFITYYAIMCTDEYKHQKTAPDYGGLCLGWNF